MVKRSTIPPMSRIIVDTRDADRDYYLPLAQAKALYEDGKLGFDETNQCFCELQNGTRTLF